MSEHPLLEGHSMLWCPGGMTHVLAPTGETLCDRDPLDRDWWDAARCASGEDPDAPAMPARPGQRIARRYENRDGSTDQPQCSWCFNRWQQLLEDAAVQPDEEALRVVDQLHRAEQDKLADTMERIMKDFPW
jgi:hypothetical protein